MPSSSNSLRCRCEHIFVVSMVIIPLIPFVSASLMTTPLIINHLQISKTLIGNGLETSSLRRSALFQYVKYLMQR